MFQQLCAPSKLFFVLSILSIILSFYYGTRLYLIFIGVVIIITWSAFLHQICAAGYETLSWMITLFPLMYCVASLYLSFIHKLTPFSLLNSLCNAVGQNVEKAQNTFTQTIKDL